MNSAEECVGCNPSSTCGFRCYYYWKGGRPLQRIYISEFFLRKTKNTEDYDQVVKKTTPNCVKTEKETTPPEVIEFSDSDEGVQNRDTKPENELSIYPLPSLNQTSAFGYDLQKRKSNNLQYLHHTGDATTEPPLYSPDTDNGCFDPIKSSDHLITLLPSQLELPFSSSEESSLSSKSFSFDTNSEQSSRKQPPDTISLIERKRLIVFNRPETVKKAMQTWHLDTLSLLDPFRSDDMCWFHPFPPRPRRKLPNISTSTSTFKPLSPIRPRTTISKKFTWTVQSNPTPSTNRHSMWLNFGIVSKLLSHSMTRQQKDGFITKGWHLSHLCGNWTCLNDKHTTVEPGSVNVGRNSCFSHRGGCEHNPECLKELKVSGTEMFGKADEEGEVVVEDPENWQGLWFDDDEIQGGEDESEAGSPSADIKTGDEYIGCDGPEDLQTDMGCSVPSEEISIASD